MTRPVGYFVHHQGRGHAERAASLANALSPHRNVVLFCARDDIFPHLADGVRVEMIPSLFENDGTTSSGLAGIETPETLHCAPLGWPGITQAIATLTGWFVAARPALFITDVSAELGQLARIASIPHLAVLQHGDRDDPGHMASYRGAAALLAPYAQRLEQPERPAWMRAKTLYAPGVGITCSALADRAGARQRLGIAANTDLVVVVGGGGGNGLSSAPLTLGARDEPDSAWVTLGKVHSEWHETPPPNLRHLGWVDNAADWIAAADRIVSTCGNTTVHQVAAVGKPWIAVPEWRYFAEQARKADALRRAGIAAVFEHWPGSAHVWRGLWAQARALDPADKAGLVEPDAAAQAAAAIERLIDRLWAGAPAAARKVTAQ